jgi:hypothetical protein
MSDVPYLTMDEIEQFERDIERLRILYQQWFMGQQKVEPQHLRVQLNRRVLQIRMDRITNAGMRFRLRGLIQRWNSYLNYWNRIGRQIQEGTYKRDIARAKRHGEQREQAAPARGRGRGPVEISDDLSDDELQAQIDAAVAGSTAAMERRARTPAGSKDEVEGGVSRRQLEEAYRALLVERQAANQSMEKFGFDEVARAVRQSAEAQTRPGQAFKLQVVGEGEDIRLEPFPSGDD